MNSGILVERALPLDDAARHVSGDRLHDVGNLVRLGEHVAADTGVVQKAVEALVAPHGDMGDGVDPQPRRFAAGDAAVEQIDVRRNFGKQRIERLVREVSSRAHSASRKSTTTLVRSAASMRA